VSDFTQNKWAVISERGREAADLTYEEARRLVHRLAGEGRHGLCIVANEAVSRMASSLTQSESTTVRDKV
jgi:hypothetical protein